MPSFKAEFSCRESIAKESSLLISFNQQIPDSCKESIQIPYYIDIFIFNKSFPVPFHPGQISFIANTFFNTFFLDYYINGIIIINILDYRLFEYSFLKLKYGYWFEFRFFKKYPFIKRSIPCLESSGNYYRVLNFCIAVKFTERFKNLIISQADFSEKRINTFRTIKNIQVEFNFCLFCIKKPGKAGNMFKIGICRIFGFYSGYQNFRNFIRI